MIYDLFDFQYALVTARELFTTNIHHGNCSENGKHYCSLYCVWCAVSKDILVWDSYVLVYRRQQLKWHCPVEFETHISFDSYGHALSLDQWYWIIIRPSGCLEQSEQDLFHVWTYCVEQLPFLLGYDMETCSNA